MGDIVSFPVKLVRDWLIIERAMNDAFIQNRTPEAAQNRLKEQMKSFYEIMHGEIDLNFDVEFPPGISREQAALVSSRIREKGSLALEEQLHAFTHKLFFDRLRREMDVCREIGLL